MSKSPPTTPPSNAVPLSASTPIHTRSTTTDRYDPKYEARDDIFQRLSDEMDSFFVGPVPLQEFLDDFLPSTLPNSSAPTFKPGMFSTSSGIPEGEMYTKFITTPLSSIQYLLRTMLRSDPAPSQKQRKCTHEHWKNCHDYPEAHTWEARDQEDIEEEEAVRALLEAEDNSYLAYDEACKVRQLSGGREGWNSPGSHDCVVKDQRPEAADISGPWLPLGRTPTGRVLLCSDPAPSQKQRKCTHEHWKNCHDYPEAHTWEARDQEDIEEEEAVRALLEAEDNSYLAYDEACKVRQLVSNMITRGRVPEAGRKVITGRARVT
ncbi:hypothetical protein EI94DRAFT_1703017 [Lactarius quietus]|nr:hypothetical protein EI94DRAFT_1703017 [Lactarius quietus]